MVDKKRITRLKKDSSSKGQRCEGREIARNALKYGVAVSRFISKKRPTPGLNLDEMEDPHYIRHKSIRRKKQNREREE